MPKVVVAMSGGVDSSVAAALLKEQGYEVIGMMLRLWSEPGKEDSNRCCTPDSMAQARRVAAKLEIPFYVIDAKDVFRETVVEYFLSGYARGETPNPCLICNQKIQIHIMLFRRNFADDLFFKRQTNFDRVFCFCEITVKVAGAAPETAAAAVKCKARHKN